MKRQLKKRAYEADCDAASYTSGIYFYELETEVFAEARKMMLVK